LVPLTPLHLSAPIKRPTNQSRNCLSTLSNLELSAIPILPKLTKKAHRSKPSSTRLFDLTHHTAASFPPYRPRRLSSTPHKRQHANTSVRTHSLLSKQLEILSHLLRRYARYSSKLSRDRPSQLTAITASTSSREPPNRENLLNRKIRRRLQQIAPVAITKP
jgi:hypothetical protein